MSRLDEILALHPDISKEGLPEPKLFEASILNVTEPDLIVPGIQSVQPIVIENPFSIDRIPSDIPSNSNDDNTAMHDLSIYGSTLDEYNQHHVQPADNTVDHHHVN